MLIAGTIEVLTSSAIKEPERVTVPVSCSDAALSALKAFTSKRR